MHCFVKEGGTGLCSLVCSGRSEGHSPPLCYPHSPSFTHTPAVPAAPSSTSLSSQPDGFLWPWLTGMGRTALCALLSLSLLLYSLPLSLTGFSVIPLWHTWTTEKELLKGTPAQRLLREGAPPAAPHSPLQMQLTPSASTVRRDAVSLPFLQLFLAQDLNLPKSNSEWGKINTKCTKDNLVTPLEL